MARDCQAAPITTTKTRSNRMGTTELQELFPTSVEVTLPRSGLTVSLTEIEMANLDRATAIKVPYTKYLSEAAKNGNGKVDGITEATALYEMISENSDVVMEFCSAASKLPIDEIKMLSLTDCMILFGKCMQVNGAFFLQATLNIAKHLKLQVGPESLPPLSETATATETSVATH